MLISYNNSIDLFFAKKSQYHNGIFHYNRRKTSKSRSDNAYFEIMVPQLIKPTFEKYMSKNMESPWLFDFQDRLSTSDSFNANVNAGISQICKKVKSLPNNFADTLPPLKSDSIKKT